MANGLTSRPEVVVFQDTRSLSMDAAYRISALASAKTRLKETFTVALAGGNTPAMLYSLLAGPQFASLLDWQYIHLFFGDERCVPTDSEFSNFRTASQKLIEPLGIPEVNVHRIPADLPNTEDGAEQYEFELRRFFGEKGLPRFDLILLGMGSDGHCASLFPQKPALEESRRWVVSTEPGLKPFVTRITLTFPVLNHAANVLFLVSGADKAETLARVLEGPTDHDALPSQSVRPTDGALTWLVDRSAAGRLQFPATDE